MSGSPPQVEPKFEAAWGAFAVLVYVSTVLSGFIAMQTCTYFHKFFHRDHYILKYTAGSSQPQVLTPYFASGCLHRVTTCHLSRLRSPSGSRLHSQWGWLSAPPYRFSHNRYLLACWCVLAGIELGTGLACMVRAAHAVPAWQDAISNEESKWLIEMTFTISVLLDTSIAGSTCYQLWRSRMMGLKRTRRVVDKLIRWTIQTGALTRLDSRIDGVSSAVSVAIILTVCVPDSKEHHLTNFMRILSDLWLGIVFILPNCERVHFPQWPRLGVGVDVTPNCRLCNGAPGSPMVRVPEPVLPRWFRDFLRHSNGTNLGNLTQRAAIGSTSTPGRWAWTQLRATSPPHFTSDTHQIIVNEMSYWGHVEVIPTSNLVLLYFTGTNTSTITTMHEISKGTMKQAATRS
ncbi:hypothetical protein BD779DRAFT_1790801 [Infundibulicybe gibba]|nr:hypothetical protein BD779DRAFT_1790801 [Infundibulicybe gibba]